MAQARLGDDGRYRGELPCRWCDTLIDQGGRRKPRLYCRMSHRWKSYGSWAVALVGGLF
ncbi:hypothetical protein JL475_06490 [Streptomyces sp. M2CJ-2]|uniref:hypothetical protein n=1 Tax=unclassified Streptomyces TaxID=2593676 RepID=UPI0015E812B2|nr:MULTISPECIES: hypothetical protein [unclassified Streptomyces]MBL3665655.1 hypothetical protein [Streptomyces sp. M2CJ-2]